MNNQDNKWVLITGGAKRIGAEVARTLHARGMNLAVHYNSSNLDAESLSNELNGIRANSTLIFGANLTSDEAVEGLIPDVLSKTGRLDVLINNASTFYPTPIDDITHDDWDSLIGTNLKAPMFLCKHAAKHLRETRGSIVNMVDIHASKPLSKHPVYGPAKSGLVMLTRSLARDLAPDVRVNGVAPGMILWPEKEPPDNVKEKIIEQIPLRRSGSPKDIANTISCLLYTSPSPRDRG